jgi:AGZA family xanthine/uracil permease-like MFS transporter
MSGTSATRGGTLATYFEFQKFGSNVQTEVLAGLSTYLSLAYIFIVTPAILSKAGLDPSAVLLATVVASSLATVAMGLWANLPFAVAPGLEMSGFFAFVVCGTLQLSWQQGLGTVFISGLLCLLFTYLRVRKSIIDSIPPGLKKAIGTSVGVFVATIGLFLAHIIAFQNGRIDLSALSTLPLTTHLAFVLYAGLVVALVFGLTPLKRIPGGLLLAILCGAALCWVWGIKAAAPPAFSSRMTQAIGRFDFSVVLNPRFWSPIIVFFIIDFLGGIGKFIGLTANTNIQDAEGNVPNLQRGLYVDGAGTILGSFLGTSSLIAFVESAVGIQAGGRTGLTALVCGVLMALSIVVTPLLRWVPAESAAGVLIFVGYLLLPGVGDTKGQSGATRFDVAVALAMGLLSFLTFSLDKAMALGFWAYFLQDLLARDSGSAARWWLGGIAALLTLTIIWQLAVA